jgi:hypothetical protein
VRIVTALKIVVFLSIMTITSLHAVESVNLIAVVPFPGVCQGKRKRLVSKELVRRELGRVVQKREKSVLSTTVNLE